MISNKPIKHFFLLSLLLINCPLILHPNFQGCCDICLRGRISLMKWVQCSSIKARAGSIRVLSGI